MQKACQVARLILGRKVFKAVIQEIISANIMYHYDCTPLSKSWWLPISITQVLKILSEGFDIASVLSYPFNVCHGSSVLIAYAR